MMPSTPLTREVQITDIAAIFDLMKVGAPGLRSWSFDAIAQEISDASSLACRNLNGELDAFIFLRDAVDAFEISYLATVPLVRQKGLMRGLLTRAIELYAVAGRPIWLDVHELNEPARRLYEATGFRQTGRRAGYYSDGGAAILYTHG